MLNIEELLLLKEAIKVFGNKLADEINLQTDGDTLLKYSELVNRCVNLSYKLNRELDDLAL